LTDGQQGAELKISITLSLVYGQLINKKGIFSITPMPGTGTANDEISGHLPAFFI
jgi:hypothetical protein